MLSGNLYQALPRGEVDTTGLHGQQPVYPVLGIIRQQAGRGGQIRLGREGGSSQERNPVGQGVEQLQLGTGRVGEWEDRKGTSPEQLGQGFIRDIRM
jgi:hypothetical protein